MFFQCAISFIHYNLKLSVKITQWKLTVKVAPSIQTKHSYCTEYIILSARSHFQVKQSYKMYASHIPSEGSVDGPQGHLLDHNGLVLKDHLNHGWLQLASLTINLNWQWSGGNELDMLALGNPLPMGIHIQLRLEMGTKTKFTLYFYLIHSTSVCSRWEKYYESFTFTKH